MKNKRLLKTGIIFFLMITVKVQSFAGGVFPGDLLITEFMADPVAVTDANGEWIEIYNTSNISIDIAGFYLSDGGADTIQIVSAVPLMIPPGGYFVLGQNSDITINGGVSVNYVFGGFTVNNATSSIILTDSLFNVIDEMSYSATVPGKSTSLDPFFYDAISNDNPLNWCSATVVYGAGDFGTPGAVNPSCGVSSVTEVGSEYPFAIYNTLSKSINVKSDGKYALSITDASGKCVASFTNENKGNSTFDLSILEEGCYIYQVITGKNFIAGKFIK
ncbi:MAG: lamin tail domain-containing protein [Bacteroidota bacterium]